MVHPTSLPIPLTQLQSRLLNLTNVARR
ncbi:hypothetical protein ACJIZ3_007225 [Penstemon smallii]|uniref:Uncharacterized protein n=1 Tax=Penstemon smallii TaxID=265156 RepID=A0ABD3SA96_9LAMI